MGAQVASMLDRFAYVQHLLSLQAGLKMDLCAFIISYLSVSLYSAWTR